MSERVRDLKVERAPISTLRPYAGNARTHTKKQIRQIVESIRTFGWTNPILIHENRRVVAGHGRLEAARLLGLEEVPVIRLRDLTEAQVRAYIIADNRLAELAGWDEKLLSIELKALAKIELDFEIEVTGFNTAEIDSLIIGPVDADDEANRVPEIDADTQPLTAPGYLWQLGAHPRPPGRAQVAEFRSARSETIPPLPWTNFAPPFPTISIAWGGWRSGWDSNQRYALRTALFFSECFQHFRL